MNPYNERTRVEDPAIDLLIALGWTFVAATDLQRDSQRSAVLRERLEAKLLEFNPWLSPENLARAVRKVTTPEASGLVEANEELHTILTRGSSVQQDLGTGIPSHTVQFVDWTDQSRNDFVVTRQFRIARSANEDSSDVKAVIFDIALFVNGLLWAVIECKDFVRGIAQALTEGREQLERYQELEDRWRGLGAPRAFEAVQIVAVIAREAAVYASAGATARFFAPFPEVYPNNLDWLAQVVGLPLGSQPTAQDVLLYSVFAPSNLFEFVGSFTVFTAVERRKVRQVARHQQRIAVDRTLRRVLGLDDPFGDANMAGADPWRLEPAERGGVIWHTQGSGKSLTMVWLAQALRAAAPLGNPSVIVVTDRVDLDKQIAGVFRGAGLSEPARAKSVSSLKKLLQGAVGATVMTTVQKFRDATAHGLVNASEKLFVLVDEAHRTQYGFLAADMRSALPLATFIAFTGTPIDKKDRSTLSTFGPYIHRYTMLESVRDGATVPIFYEGRDLEQFFVAGRNMDEVFDHWFADYSPDDRERIKAKFATLETVAGASERVKAIAWDIIKHYRDFIADNGFKAQIVTASREIAVKYKDALDALDGPPSEVVFTVSSGDDANFKRFERSAHDLEGLLERFAKDASDPVKFLVVVDMLLTGFDAPLEQVMYLDKPLREHALLQAIARVNRPALGKDRGFIVDYWGVTDDLREALSIFDPVDLREVLRPLSSIVMELQSRHSRVMRVFGGQRIEVQAALQKLDDELQREEFNQAYKFFAQSLNALLPDPRAEAFKDDFKWLSRVWLEARAVFDRQVTPDWSGIAPKVRKLIDEGIRADGVTQVVAPVDVLSGDFDAHIADLPSLDAQALEMAHAAQHEIRSRFSENPVLYSSLRDRLEQIIASRRDGRIGAAEQVSALLEVVERLRNAPQNRAQQLGLTPDAEALYGLLEAVGHADTDLARSVERTLRELIVVEWTQKTDVLREMRRLVKRELRGAGVDKAQLEPLASQMLDVAMARMVR